MSVQQLTIPAPAPWINSNDRKHRMQEAKLIAAWRAAGAKAAAGLPQFDGPIRIWAQVWKPIANRYDPQNFYPTGKACVDGMRDAGVLVDDDWRHVEGPFMVHGGKGEPRLIFTFEIV